tara:strand:- start:579 stop:1139 length:561 start_codon:yes stop_codon:yes gene_type:complete
MADTGERSPQAHSGFTSQGANAIDSNESTNASMIHFNTSPVISIVSNFDGDDIPAGSIIDGIKLIIRASYSASFNSSKIKASVSLDGVGGTFGSDTDFQNITTTTTDYDFGGATELWGISWSGWTDLSDLAFKITSDQQDGSVTTCITGIYEVDAIVYYTIPSRDNANLNILSGNTTLRGGKIIIK